MDSSDPEISGCLALHVVGNHTSYLNQGFHERILELQKEKRSLADAVISADASLIRSLTAEDLTLLLS